MAKNNLYIEFANEIGVFPINVGTTFSDDFSEKLDSASVIISKIDRKLNIKPNDEVRIYNENGTILGETSLYYLIDTVYCKEITLNNTIQYQYTIELKSLTSYLDLIQLPNRALNHSLVSGQKSIMDYIDQFVFLYSPKIKVKTENGWDYQPLIEVDDYLVDKYGDTFIYKFHEPCRDLNFSMPTLRQVLTTLMLQVGCLPKIIKVNGKNILSYIDLRRAPTPFINRNSMNYTNYSYASDSYVNVLKTIGGNVLDDKNIVVNEIIGFRDNNNVLIKQTENLRLNTRLPIYDVKKLGINLIGTGNLAVRTQTPFYDNNCIVALKYEDGKIGVVEVDAIIDFPYQLKKLYTEYSNIRLKGKLYIYNLSSDESGEYVNAFNSVYDVVDIDDTISGDDNVIAQTNGGSALKGAIFIGSVSAVKNDTSTSVSGDFIISTVLGNIITAPAADRFDVCVIQYPFNVDITKLCVEQHKRQLLDTNFLTMQEVSSIDELSKYIYGTVGYNIGGQTIEGFSQMYSKTVAWWNESYTYIENIVNTILNICSENAAGNKFFDYMGEYRERIFQEKLGTPNISNIFIRDFNKTTALYSSLTFDLTYQPLNKLNLTHTKKESEINIPFEQLDTSENAISNFDNIMEVEQQKVNRLGNEVVVKNQRCFDFSEINDLNSSFNDYIVFNRTISVGIEDFKVNYTASKNYVLQNYFTAIQTKYRAYEYIDYGQSILRQENNTIYALIDRYYFDGDDNIKWGNTTSYNLKLENLLLSGADSKYYTNTKFVSGGMGEVGSDSKYYANDLSIATYKDGMVFSFQTYDSVSYGQRINFSSSSSPVLLGGLQQEWYIKDNLSFTICSIFASNKSGANILDLVNNEKFDDVMQRLYNLPLMDNIDSYVNENGESVDNYNLMFLVSDNKTSSIGKYYYLDQQELLNQTIQFEFYTTDNGIKWTEKLWELCNLVCDKPKGEKFIYVGVDEEFGINEKGYNVIDTSKLIPYDNTQITLFSGFLLQTGSGLTINWNEIASAVDFIKIVYKEDNKYYDLLAVERTGNNESENIYITLNDTKTDKVAYSKNGLYSFNEYVVAKNTLNRSVEKL